MSAKKPAPSPSRPAAKKPAAKKAHEAPAAIVPLAVANASSSCAGLTIKPPRYDAVAAKALFDAFRPRLAAIPAEKVAVPRADVRAAALAALGVYAFVTQADAIHERFEKQHNIGEFNLANLEDLKAATFIVLYTHARAEAVGTFKTSVKVPPKLAREGSEVEKRMQELCEYKFKRDPEIAPRLALLSPGTGHEDLAADLLGYADIYAMRPAEVPLDTTNYRHTDLTDARRIAGEIMAHLTVAMSPNAREAYDLLRRAWTLLLQIYSEVQQMGRFLLRADPKGNDWFPSLYAAGRVGRPRKKRGDGAGRGEVAGKNPPAG